MDGVDAGAVLDLPAARLAVTGGDVRARLPHVAKERLAHAIEISYFSFFSPYVPAIRSNRRPARSRSGPDQREQVERGLADPVARAAGTAW